MIVSEYNVKNVIIVFFLFARIFSVSADSGDELCVRLGYVNSFYAKFIQKIIDSTGVILQESNGELYIQRPNCFHYHVIFPEEIFLISDGIVFWFYDPYVNQVIISWLQDVIDNTFLMLLSNNQKLSGNKRYHIHKNGDTFCLIPKKNQNLFFDRFEINISNQGIIRKINIFNKEGNNINYQLTEYNKNFSDNDKFTFSPPDGVEIDEQRR